MRDAPAWPGHRTAPFPRPALRRGSSCIFTLQALTHGALASANILKTALYGWNPMAINLAYKAGSGRDSLKGVSRCEGN